MMKKLCKLCLVLFLMIPIFACIPVQAENFKFAGNEKTFLFAVPGGGWASATIRIRHTEYHRKWGRDTQFYSRERSILFRRAYATSAPYSRDGVVRYSNGRTFLVWSQQQAMYGSPWQFCSCYKNTDKVLLDRKTNVKGLMNASVHCNGSIVPIRTISTTMSLWTH